MGSKPTLPSGYEDVVIEGKRYKVLEKLSCVVEGLGDGVEREVHCSAILQDDAGDYYSLEKDEGYEYLPIKLHPNDAFLFNPTPDERIERMRQHNPKMARLLSHARSLCLSIQSVVNASLRDEDPFELDEFEVVLGTEVKGGLHLLAGSGEMGANTSLKLKFKPRKMKSEV